MICHSVIYAAINRSSNLSSLVSLHRPVYADGDNGDLASLSVRFDSCSPVHFGGDVF
jgi:hypothetical protein